MVLQSAGQLSPLIELYQDALCRGIPPPDQLYNAVIFAYAQQGALQKGLEVLGLMKAAGCKSGQWTYAYLLQGCAKWDPNPNANPKSNPGLDLTPNSDIVLDSNLDLDPVWNRNFDPGLGLDPNLERETVGGSNNRSAIEIADALAQEMLSSGVRHSLVTLIALAEVYARGGQVARALELFRNGSEHGVKPDASSYVNLFHACIEGGAQLGELLDAYREMVKGRIKPFGAVYYPLLRACAQETNLSNAYELFTEMRKFGVGPDAKHYASLVYVCGVAGEVDRAEDLLTEMLTQGLEPTVVTWNALLSAMRRGGSSFAQMKPIVGRMRASGAKPDCITYSVLLQVCKAEGRVNTAQRIYTEFRAGGLISGPRAQVYREALEIFARAGMVEECETITAQMHAEGLGFTQRAHEVLIGVYAAVLDYPAMAKALRAMIDEGLTPGIAANDHLARALAEGGRVEELLVLLKTIEERGGEFPGRVCHHVIRAYMNVPDEVSMRSRI
jgi:pentatricopeptide repeat protein